MSRMFIRLWLYNKRLLKKPSFVCILIFCISFVFLLSIAVGDDTAILKIAVASDEPDDPIYRSVFSKLDGGLIDVAEYDPQGAAEAVESGNVDAAWIFPNDLEGRIGKYTDAVAEENYVVRVIQREESVLLQISREKLMASLYPYLSKSLYRGFMDMRYPQLAEKGNDFLDSYYDKAEAEGEDVFRIVTTDGANVSSSAGVLLSPIRGILSVFAVIGGLAVSLYTIRDEREGRFNFIPEGKRLGEYLAYELIAVSDILVVSLFAIFFAGLNVDPLREIASALLLLFSTVGFCLFLRMLLHKEGILGAVIPVVCVVIITICPIFINVSVPLWCRLLLPPYGYLAGIYSESVLLPWFGISCAFYVAAYALFTLRLKWLRKILG